MVSMEELELVRSILFFLNELDVLNMYKPYMKNVKHLLGCVSFTIEILLQRSQGHIYFLY